MSAATRTHAPNVAVARFLPRRRLLTRYGGVLLELGQPRVGGRDVEPQLCLPALRLGKLCRRLCPGTDGVVDLVGVERPHAGTFLTLQH